MNKLVSIILPTYNGKERIVESIASVLAQSYTNWELLIIDDGSIDNTENKVAEFTKRDSRIVYLKNEKNLGIQKTLNRGLKEAKGEYIARIDDDDEWVHINKLQQQIEFLEKNEDHVLVGTGVIVVDKKNKELYRYLLPQNDSEIRKKILGQNCFVHSSIVFRKSFTIEFGGYNESLNVRHVEDYDLWLKIGTVGKFANLSIYAVKFCLRGDSISSKNKLEQFKKNLNLIKHYKNKYPNFFFSTVRSYLRIIIYGFILKLPLKFTLNKLTKYYKETW